MAMSMAARKLVVEAMPFQAMSKAVPWSTEVRTMGRPRAMLTPPSKSRSFEGMWPWWCYMLTTASKSLRRTAM